MEVYGHHKLNPVKDFKKKERGVCKNMCKRWI